MKKPRQKYGNEKGASFAKRGGGNQHGKYAKKNSDRNYSKTSNAGDRKWSQKGTGKRFHDRNNESGNNGLQESYTDIVFGKNAVYETLLSGSEANKLIVLKDSKDHTIQKAIDMCKEKQVPIDFVERSYLDLKFRYVKHGGVVLHTAPFAYADVDDLLAIAEARGEDPFLVILDGIEDPHNLGAIIRTAEAAGAHGVIIPRRGCAPVNETVIRTSSGAAQHLKVARVSNLVSTIESLKKQRLWIVGAAPEGNTSYTKFNLKGALAIVIGSEGAGMSRLVQEHCDAVLAIPMHGKTSSLNASVAAGVLIFEALRQRG